MIKNKEHLKREEVGDVLRGEDAWKNATGLAYHARTSPPVRNSCLVEDNTDRLAARLTSLFIVLNSYTVQLSDPEE